MIIVVLYIINILSLKYFTYGKDIFWNADVAFICLLYYSLGYYIKEEKDNKYLAIISFILLFVISLLWHFDLLKITFNMKNKSLFYNPLTQIVFPLSVTLFLLKLLSFIDDKNIIKQCLCYIGKSSLVIMYLHMLIFNTLIYYTSFSYFLKIIISTIIPIIGYWMCNKNKYLKIMFIG